MKNGNCGTQDSRLSPQWTHDARTRGHFDISPGTRNLRHDTRRDDIKTECPGTLHNRTTINPQPTSNAHDLTPTHLHTTQPASIHDTSHQLQHFTLYHPIPYTILQHYNLQPTTYYPQPYCHATYILHPQKHYPSTHHPTNLSPCSLQSSNNLQPTTYNLLQPTTFNLQRATTEQRATWNLDA